MVDVTEVTERVDNAFKVTGDVYWNRLYSATLSVLRVQLWREGVDHNLMIDWGGPEGLRPLRTSPMVVEDVGVAQPRPHLPPLSRCEKGYP